MIPPVPTGFGKAARGVRYLGPWFTWFDEAIFCAKATSHALVRNPFERRNVISYERQFLVQRLFMLLQSTLPSYSILFCVATGYRERIRECLHVLRGSKRAIGTRWRFSIIRDDSFQPTLFEKHPLRFCAACLCVHTYERNRRNSFTYWLHATFNAA